MAALSLLILPIAFAAVFIVPLIITLLEGHEDRVYKASTQFKRRKGP
jgi:hypothetical protein